MEIQHDHQNVVKRQDLVSEKCGHHDVDQDAPQKGQTDGQVVGALVHRCAGVIIHALKSVFSIHIIHISHIDTSVFIYSIRISGNMSIIFPAAKKASEISVNKLGYCAVRKSVVKYLVVGI